jgi:hypothetical protein
MAHDPLSTAMAFGASKRKPAITIRGLLVITLLIAFALLSHSRSPTERGTPDTMAVTFGCGFSSR